MSSTITIGKPLDEGMRALLTALLESKAVRAVLTLRRLEEGGGVAYSLVTDPKAIAEAVPLLPVMPTSGGQVLSHLTQEEELKEPVAAVVRPCEVRGFVELVKRNKGFMENLILISPECPGVFPLRMAVGDPIDDEVAAYWKAAAEGTAAPGVRAVCGGCERFEPMAVDMTVRLIGVKDMDKRLTVRLETERAEELVKGLKLDTGKGVDKDPKALEAFRELRARGGSALREELDLFGEDMASFIETFGRCISCHACSKACPICYCQMCYFEAKAAAMGPTWWRNDLLKKGAARAPPGTVFFHVGRLLHMSISCVACGMCEDVCPVDIPVARIFKQVGEAAQEMFEYVPGKDVDEEIPIRTFVEDELHEVER
jgi:formate dehydrogenase subunit beta